MTINIKDLKKKKDIEYSFVGARIHDDLKTKLDTCCKTNKLSVSAVLVALIEEFLADKSPSD